MRHILRRPEMQRKKLKRALADTEEILKEYAEMEDEDERNRKDGEDKLFTDLSIFIL